MRYTDRSEITGGFQLKPVSSTIKKNNKNQQKDKTDEKAVKKDEKAEKKDEIEKIDGDNQ